MKLFYDTSAWIPLLLQEESSSRMWDVKLTATEIWAWNWMRVETESTLARRQASPECWGNWNQLREEVNWVDLAPQEVDTLCFFNRGLKLRAADAGHLFVFDRLFTEFSGLVLLTLDKELAFAARKIGLPLHPECPHEERSSLPLDQ